MLLDGPDWLLEGAPDILDREDDADAVTESTTVTVDTVVESASGVMVEAGMLDVIEPLSMTGLSDPILHIPYGMSVLSTGPFCTHMYSAQSNKMTEALGSSNGTITNVC